MNVNKHVHTALLDLARRIEAPYDIKTFNTLLAYIHVPTDIQDHILGTLDTPLPELEKYKSLNTPYVFDLLKKYFEIHPSSLLTKVGGLQAAALNEGECLSFDSLIKFA